MLTKNIKKTLILASVAVGLFSCRSMVEGYENSPNSPTSAPAPILLTSAQVSSAYLAGGEPTRLSGMWSGYFTGSDRQYLSYYSYDVNAGVFDDMWSNIYVETITQARLATQGADKAKNPIVGGIARIIEANAVGNATALFGNIPFSETIDGSKSQPVFDNQADVYAGVQKLLDQAIVNLSSGTGSVPNDIFYGGNSAKWLKVAYTLKARFFMHTRNYQEAYTNALKGIATSADDMTFKYGGNQEKDQNIYYDFGQNNRQGYLTSNGAMAVKMLTAGNAMYRGNAKTDETSRKMFYYTADGSDLNYEDGMFGATSSTPVVTYAENTLILAEAAARNTPTNLQPALDHLNAYRTWLAGKFSSKYDAYTLADFAPGGIDNKGTLSAERALLKEILEERYISFIAQLEGFNDLRRTFKENDVRVVAPINKGTQFPQRFLYAQAELNSNPKAPKQTPTELFEATPVNK